MKRLTEPRLCNLKDYGKDIGFIPTGMEKAVEGFMHWSKIGAMSNLYSKMFGWPLWNINCRRIRLETETSWGLLQFSRQETVVA